jgi:hypothetical protein
VSSSATASEPCHACLDFEVERHTWSLHGVTCWWAWFPAQDVTLEKIMTTAKAGCRGCKVILFVVKPVWSRFDDPRIGLNALRVAKWPHRSFWVELWVNAQVLPYKFELYKLPGKDDGV